MRRRVLLSQCLDETLVGTLHAVQADAPTAGARTALLLLNAGPAPRAGNSDLSAHLGDHLAGAGLPCFRFDVPGLGDSTGPPPRDTTEYWLGVQKGRNSAFIAALLQDLRTRFGIESFILGGLCAGAISAVLACVAAPVGVSGLLLLEPNFRTAAETGPNAQTADAGAAPARAAKRSRLARVLDLNEVLYVLTGESIYARPLAPLRPWLQSVLTRRIGGTLPRDANAALVLAWGRALEHGVPSLVVTAQGHHASRYVERIVASLPHVAPGVLRVVKLEGTNHILTFGDARRQVCAAVTDWIGACFPGALRAPSPEPALSGS